MNTQTWVRGLGLILGLAILAGPGRAAAGGGQAVALLNGRNLDGWTHVLADETVKREQVWSVRDGMLICTGTPIGVLYTKKNYKNFRLVVEYRWAPGAPPGNSGVM